MPNTKFLVWEGQKLRTLFYSSDNKELSITEKMRICEFLGISLESARFFVTHETIDAAQLPPNPTFEIDGRKFWLASA